MSPEPVETIRGSLLFTAQRSNSNRNIPTATLIRDAEAFKTLFQDMRLTSPGIRHLLPVVNFELNCVLLITMGMKNTEGFKLGFESNKPIEVYPDHINLSLVWFEPSPGSDHKASKINPCVMIGLPKGEYKKVRIYDQSRRLRFVAAL